ncbi:hypothetical protein [Photobacterium leiognathi]|uniref:hypothetical protein n=1 Tax=Photobacterium leiognathi TaxID=553611 RepID=UPI00298242C5|nr:hypothetical protein [Photobacterium leiognathi]
MKKQEGFLLPLVVVGLIGVSAIAMYNQRSFDRQENDKRALFIANNIIDTINYVQEYQLVRAKEDKENGIDPDPENQFPSSLTDLAQLGSVPNCVETPAPEQVATNCDAVTKSAFGGDMVLITDPDNNKRKLLKVDVSNFNFGNTLSQNSVRTVKNMSNSQKRDWALVKRVSSLIVRSEIVREADHTWLQVPIDMASAYTPSAPDSYLQLDGKVELTNDWDTGNKRIIAGNGKIQLTDGTKLGSDRLIMGAGVRTVDIGRTSIEGIDITDRHVLDFSLCKKMDGTTASSSNPYTAEDIKVSGFISAIYPLVDTKMTDKSNVEQDMPNNAFANIATFGLTSDIKYQYNRYWIHFYLINYGRDAKGQNGFWGDTNATHNYRHEASKIEAQLGASEVPLGANISYIISCKRALTDD